MKHDIYEPWIPEAGQRVRVRLSPECPKAGHCDPSNPDEWGWLERDTGVVLYVADDEFRRIFPDGHWYAVEFDDERQLDMDLFGLTEADLDARDDPAPNDWYAAAELEVVA